MGTVRIRPKYIVMRPNLHKSLLKVLISLILITMQCGYSLAQQKTTLFSYYTIDDGLSQNLVHCMLKDSNGFMWFGTWNGLNRFDGYNFTVFKRGETKTAISSNFIYALEEDSFGNIWIGTDNGLNLYIYELDKTITLDSGTRSYESIISGHINALKRDSSDNIWIGTDSGIDVVSVLDSRGAIRPINRFTGAERGGRLTGSHINCIFEDSRGLIWIGTNNGLNMYDGETGKFHHYTNEDESISHNTVNTVYEDKYGNIWVGTYYGLNRIDHDSGEITVFHHLPNSPESISHNVIRAITEDIDGNLIIGTLGGISVYNETTGTFSNTRQAGNNIGLNNIFVSCLLSDSQGNVWIGTENGGVNRYNVLQNQFSFFEKKTDQQRGLNHNTVNSVFEDNNYIWIGTAGGGLNRYNKQKGTFSHYIYDQSDPASLENNFVSAVTRASDGNIYVGTWGGGLHRLDRDSIDSGNFHHFPVDPGTPQNLPDYFISSLAEDKFGYLWVGTREGLARIELSTGKIDNFPEREHNRTISGIGFIEFDSEDNLWVGTSYGLYKIQSHDRGKIDPEKNEVIQFLSDPDDPYSIASNFITYIHMDISGDMWFGTYGNGICRLEESNNFKEFYRFENFNQSDGLTNNVVFGILGDNSGNMWISTDYGLSRFSVLERSFKNYYTSDGLKNNQYYWTACHKNKSGKLYFGGTNGLNTFYPDSIKERMVHPNIVFTDFLLDGKPVELGARYNDKVLLENSVIQTENIDMSYMVREFSVGFSALLYDQPNKVKYAYKLEGFDQDWNYVDANRRYASYMNLPGGNYVLKVKATDNHGNWNDDYSSIEINIIPPFYTSVWFIGLMILLLAGAIITYNKYTLFIIRLQKQILEKKVRIRTSQIEAQKEKLIGQAKYLNESLFQLENRKLQIEEQKRQLENKNIKIQAQRDKLSRLHQKVNQINQQQLNFFTNISHEFRTTLSLIISPLEQLMSNKSISVNPELKKSLELINKNADRLLRLINQLMDIRKIESGYIRLKCTESDIVGFTQKIYNSFDSLAEKNNIDYRFISSEKAIYTYFDREKVENMLYNLISNAFKYTTAGGKIEVIIARTFDNDQSGCMIAENGRQEVNGFDKELLNLKDPRTVVEQSLNSTQNLQKGYINILIRDNGIGIESDKLQTIFQRFNRLQTPSNNLVRGSGIGLNLTKELVRIHKGSLYVSSAPNMGSAFKILLPKGRGFLSEKDIVIENRKRAVSSKETHPSIYDTTEEKTGAGSNELTGQYGENAMASILVVEDDEEMREFIVNNLRKRFRVIEACNGTEGIHLALEYIPDLILSDVMMPDMDGLTMCRKLKHEMSSSHIPVILLTAKSEAEYCIEGLQTGADDYITKPFNVDVLEAKIVSFLENRKLLRKIFSSSIQPIPQGIITNSQNKEFLEKTVSLIEDNISNPELNVKMLAEELCVSRSLLHKKLTTIAGQSANDFITSIRLKSAIALFREGKSNITEVAFEIGFNDPKYFSRCFKKHFNVSPSGFIGGKAEKIFYSPVDS